MIKKPEFVFEFKIIFLGLIVGNLDANLKQIISYISEAQKYEADIVAFPELAICGYPPEDLLLKAHFIDDNLKALETVKEKVGNIYVVLGFIDRDNSGNLYNAAALIHDKNILGICRKIELPNYGVFDEKRFNIKRRRLQTGDYTIEGFEKILAVERKDSILEVALNISGKHRKRFEAAIQRLARFKHKYFIIEDDPKNILRTVRKLPKKSSITTRSLCFWFMKIMVVYKIPVLFIGSGRPYNQEFLDIVWEGIIKDIGA